MNRWGRKWLPLIALVALAAASVSHREKRAALEQRTESEIARLRRHREAFQKLPREEQAKMMELHAFLTSSGEARDDYEETMGKYLRWLDTLPPSFKELIANAGTPAEKLKVIDALIERQNARLAEDLKPLHAGETSSGPRRGLPRFPPPGKPGRNESFRGQDQALEERLSDAERTIFRSLGFRDQLAFRSALVMKHQVGNEQTRGWCAMFINHWCGPLFFRTPFAEAAFLGKTSYTTLTPEELDRFHKLLVFSFFLPPVSVREVIMHYPSGDLRRQLYEDMAVSGACMNPFYLVYYYDHPDTLHPLALRSAFEKLLRTGEEPSLPAPSLEPSRRRPRSVPENLPRPMKRALEKLRNG